MRIDNHPILGETERGKKITIYYNNEPVESYEGEMISAALWAAGKRIARNSAKRHEPRGLFCAIGYCADCLMEVDGVSNIRTCVTPVRDGMKIEVQEGHGKGVSFK